MPETDGVNYFANLLKGKLTAVFYFSMICVYRLLIDEKKDWYFLKNTNLEKK